MLICIFICKLFYLTTFCSPSNIMYKASKSHSLFSGVALLGLVMNAFPVLLFLTDVPPSFPCGPFRGYTNSFGSIKDSISHSALSDMLYVFHTPIVGVVILILQVLGMYYFWVQALSNRAVAARLKTEIAHIASDMAFAKANFITRRKEIKRKMSRTVSSPEQKL